MSFALPALSGALALFAAWCARSLRRALRVGAPTPRRFLERPRPPGEVVVCCGDSITRGQTGANWVARLNRRGDGRRYVNAGVNGHTAWNLAQRLDEIVACEPDAVVVLVGTNDAIGSLNERLGRRYQRMFGLPDLPSLAGYERSLREILDRLQRDTRARVAVCTLPWIGERSDAEIMEVVRAHNAIIEAAAAERGIPMLPLHDEMSRALAGREGPAFGEGLATTLRMMWVPVLHYGLGRSWDAVGARYGFRALVDGVHLNEAGAAALQRLAEGFVDGR